MSGGRYDPRSGRSQQTLKAIAGANLYMSQRAATAAELSRGLAASAARAPRTRTARNQPRNVTPKSEQRIVANQRPTRSCDSRAFTVFELEDEYDSSDSYHELSGNEEGLSESSSSSEEEDSRVAKAAFAFSVRDTLARWSKEKSQLGTVMIENESVNGVPGRLDIERAPVDIDRRGSPVPRACSGTGNGRSGGPSGNSMRDRSGYLDGFGGARWESVARARRNLSKDLSAVIIDRDSGQVLAEQKVKIKLRSRKPEKSTFIQFALFWLFIFVAFSNDRVPKGFRGALDSPYVVPLLEDIVGGTAYILHRAMTPVMETAAYLLTTPSVLADDRTEISAAAAAHALQDIDEIITFSKTFANISRPVLLGLIAGELNAEAGARASWSYDGMREAIHNLSAAFEDAFEDLKAVTALCKDIIRRARERYSYIAIMLKDQVADEFLPILRLGRKRPGSHTPSEDTISPGKKYSSYTIKTRYEHSRYVSLRDFKALRLALRKAINSATSASGKTKLAQRWEALVLEKVLVIVKLVVKELEGLDKDTIEVVKLLIYDPLIPSDYKQWVTLDGRFLQEKVESLYSALRKLEASERLEKALYSG